MRFAVVLLSLFLLSCPGKADMVHDDIGLITRDQIKPGISLSQLRTVYPDIQSGESGFYSSAETLKGLQGTWSFAFDGNLLSWAIFDSSFTVISEELFYHCKNSTEEIIQQMSQIFGSPDMLEKGIQIFRDPVKDNHWGYPVIRAEWSKGREKRNVQFIFQGGRGESYKLRVSLEIRP